VKWKNKEHFKANLIHFLNKQGSLSTQSSEN
jgi:hypothetical protein